jgi:hypothetical protein
MPHLTLKVEPVAVRKEHTESNDLADHYLSHSIKITATGGKIGDAGRVPFLVRMPHRIKMNT